MPGRANGLLASLPADAFARLERHLQPVDLKRGDVVAEYNSEIRHVYFPDTAVLSLLALTQGGDTIEIGVVGFEAFAGVSYLLNQPRVPYRIVPQVAGRAYRLEARLAKREFDRGEAFQSAVHAHLLHLVAQTAQSAICNHFHSFEQRFCRWLLAMHDRIDGDVLPLTHELISHMLGAPRTSVTAIARRVQDAGLIRYRWGQITIVDRPGMERSACECYHMLRAHFPSHAKERRAAARRRTG